MTPAAPRLTIAAQDAALDLARAAAAVVCTPVAIAHLYPAEGPRAEALHGLSEDEDGGADREAARAFARLAVLKSDPLYVPDLARASGLPPELSTRRTRFRWCGGVTLLGAGGRMTGVVCVFDRSARSGGKAALERLAALVRGFDPDEVSRPQLAGEESTRRAERVLALLEGAGQDLARLLEGIRGECETGLEPGSEEAELRASLFGVLHSATRAAEVVAALRAVLPRPQEGDAPAREAA